MHFIFCTSVNEFCLKEERSSPRIIIGSQACRFLKNIQIHISKTLLKEKTNNQNKFSRDNKEDFIVHSFFVVNHISHT